MTLNTPTRKVETSELTGLTQEFASLHSVELTNTVKDGWRVSVVKVYANDPDELGALAASVALKAAHHLANIKVLLGGESAT